jgi:glycosyltransferase involved in cell wall biosynthesis
MKLNITLPVLNEERQLPRAVAELTTFLRANIGGSFEVVIVDNGSTDGTWAVAERLAARHPEVRAMRLAKRGRHTKP